MAIVYLEPDDLSAAQQTRILRVINLATDAAALADAIELAGEPDVGIRLAERLLRARAALNGQFTTLTQIDAVSGIGPERFTDLCVAILGLQREQLARLGNIAGHRLSEASAVEYANARLQLQIDVDQKPAWLGQTLRLTVRASQNGAPLVNRVLTLETSLGTLAYSFGFAQTSGSALQVRTGADGCARLTLDYEAYEPLTRDQHNALQIALDALDTSADTPEEIRVAFNELAAQYDDERNIYLRRALDIYSKHGQQFWDRFNAVNAEFEWPQQSAVIRAYLHGSDSSQAVLASAVSIVRWKNWVPAWFVFLHDWLANRATLLARLALIKRKGLRGYALVDNLIGEAHTFVAAQKGFAAELVSQHLVNDTVKRFLSTELEDVADDTKRLLFPNLELAAEQIRRGNRGSLELVANTRTQLKVDIADIGALDAGLVEEIRGIRDEVNRRAVGIQEQLDVFARDRDQFNDDFGNFVRDNAQFGELYGRFARDVGTFSERYSDFERNLSSFNGNYSTFNTNYSNFNANYSAFNTDYNNFNTNYSRFNTNYNSFNSNYATFNNNLSTFNTNYATFNTNLGGFNSNLGNFNTNLNRFNTDYTRFNTDYTSFNQNRTVMANQLAVVTTNVSSLQTQNNQLANQLNAVSNNLTQAQTEITGINRRLVTRGPG